MLCEPDVFVKSVSKPMLLLTSAPGVLPKTLLLPSISGTLISGRSLSVVVGGRGMVSPMLAGSTAAERLPSGVFVAKRENEALKSPNKVGEKTWVKSCVATQFSLIQLILPWAATPGKPF